MLEGNPDFSDWLRELQRSDQAEVDKLKEFFGLITARIVDYAEKEIDLAKAMQDRDAMVKQQIKMESFKTAREIFARGYQIATGKAAWHDQDKR